MNTLDIQPAAPGQVRVTIRSEGERDQAATITIADLRAKLDELDAATETPAK